MLPSLHLSFGTILENQVGQLFKQFSLFLTICFQLILASYCSLLNSLHQTIIKKINHEYHKRQWKQNIGSKPGKNPSKGKTQKYSLLFL